MIVPGPNCEIMGRMRQKQKDQVPAIGIDFGTTNSTVARASGKSQVELVSFPTLAGETFSFRSVLYLEQVKRGASAKDPNLDRPGGDRTLPGG